MKDEIETEEGKPCDHRKKGHSEDSQDNKKNRKKEIGHALLSDTNLKILSTPRSPNLKEVRMNVMGKIVSRAQTGKGKLPALSPNSISTDTKRQEAFNNKRHIKKEAKFIMISTMVFDHPESFLANTSILIWRPSWAAMQAATKPTQRTRCLVSSSTQRSPVEKKFLRIT